MQVYIISSAVIGITLASSDAPPNDDPLVVKLEQLKQNLQRCIYSNSRADPLEKLNEDDFVLDRNRQMYLHNQGEDALTEMKASLCSLVEQMKQLRLFSSIILFPASDAGMR